MLFICLSSVIENSLDTADINLEAAILAAANGDTAALGKIYDAVSSSVYGYALTLLHNSHDAEDILHECFIAIWSSAGGYTPEGKPMAWILTITRNLCYMKLRKNKNASHTSLEDALSFAQGSYDASVEDKLLLKEIIGELSAEESEIVAMHALFGFRHREISQMTGLPLATVLSKYSRAVKKLKSKLSEGGFDL